MLQGLCVLFALCSELMEVFTESSSVFTSLGLLCKVMKLHNTMPLGTQCIAHGIHAELQAPYIGTLFQI